MVIDCDDCAVRGLACGDCVVTVLLGGPPQDDAVEDGDATPRAHRQHPGELHPGEPHPGELHPGDRHPGRRPAGAGHTGRGSGHAVVARPGQTRDPTFLELDATERWAVHNLAAAGLVPPLRMVPIHDESCTLSDLDVTRRRRSAG